jgi:Kef-type K+ transport system membrane component KefB
MASFELQVRRVSVVADVAFLGAVAVSVGIRLVSGHFWMGSVLLIGLTFGYMVVGHFARILLNTDSETRRGVAHAIVWVANIVIVLPLLFYLAAPNFSEPMFSPPPPTWLGIPTGFWILGLGVAMLLIGRVWIHRILHEGREPETNDRFWWSRA